MQYLLKQSEMENKEKKAEGAEGRKPINRSKLQQPEGEGGKQESGKTEYS